jgi:hypothetical protein
MEQMTGERADAELPQQETLSAVSPASVEQFRSAHPQSGECFRLKPQYDPKNLSENAFHLKYAGS